MPKSFNGRGVGIAFAASAVLLPSMLLAGPFAGPDLWTDPAPGFHQIRAEGTGLCVQRVGGAIRTQLPHLQLQNCDPSLFDQRVEMAPSGVLTSPPLNATPVTWRIMTREKCLTAARGVVFGAPAVDELTCDQVSSGSRPTLFGAADQTWSLVRVSTPGHVMIAGGDGRCWTAQGGEARAGVQLVMEPCGASRGQRFKVGPVEGDVSTVFNVPAAEQFGWQRLTRPQADGVARFRSMPAQNLPSGDYTQGIATANDQGAACAQACADDVQCRGFTWVDPRARGGTPMCYKKNTLNSPVADNFTQSGIVRPG
jgi:PAN domain